MGACACAKQFLSAKIFSGQAKQDCGHFSSSFCLLCQRRMTKKESRAVRSSDRKESRHVGYLGDIAPISHILFSHLCKIPAYPVVMKPLLSIAG